MQKQNRTTLVLLRHFDNQEEHQTHASYYHLSL